MFDHSYSIVENDKTGDFDVYDFELLLASFGDYRDARFFIEECLEGEERESVYVQAD